MAMQQGSGPIVGWDIGGVHLKAVLVEDGRIAAVAQVPCALWRGIPALDDSFERLPDWARGPALNAVTMTGELCDAFPNRQAGVEALAAWAAERLAGRVTIYGGRAGFLPTEAAASRAIDVASANWHATARLVGRLVGEGLLVDIGSTTADLIPVVSGAPAAAGYTDAERLATGELVYTGAVRTPVMALAERVPFEGRLVALMAEHFATTADVHRLLGLLPEEADQQETADGRGKSVPESEVRLARMIGRDAGDAPSAAWRDLASLLAESQLRRLHDAAAQVLSGAAIPRDAAVIGCGVGRFLARHLAERLDRPYRDLADLVEADRDAAAWASSCAPAAAVAWLAADTASA